MKTFIFLIIFCLVSCGTPLVKTYTNSFIENNTEQGFKLLHYSNGTIKDILTQNFVTVEKKEVQSLLASDLNHLNPYLIVISGDATGIDSLKIVFSNQKSLTFYNKGVTGNNSNAFAYENNRNLFNDANWVKSKDGDNTIYTFTYTKEDYLLAK